MSLSIQERLKDLRVERGLTLEPVSYTHLKAIFSKFAILLLSGLFSVTLTTVLFGIPFSYSGGVSIKAPILLKSLRLHGCPSNSISPDVGRRIPAVSYTHLDVYKRQI